MRGTERRNIKYKFIRNAEINAVRSLVEYEILNLQRKINTFCRGKYDHMLINFLQETFIKRERE